jgi:hypothetical protein
MASTQKAFIRRLRKVYGVNVRTRAQWGTKHRATYWQRLVTRPAKVPVDTIVEHITVTFDDGKFTGNFDADCREVERIGWERFGSGVSYNFLVDQKTGMVGIGQDLRAKGTHTVNDKNKHGYSHDQNKVARAIAWIGVPGNQLSEVAVTTHVKIIACLMDTGHCTADPDYLPHSFFAAKDCPTDTARNKLPAILRRAKELHHKNRNVRTPRR